jgi:hypothetical protein
LEWREEAAVEVEAAEEEWLSKFLQDYKSSANQKVLNE